MIKDFDDFDSAFSKFVLKIYTSRICASRFCDEIDSDFDYGFDDEGFSEGFCWVFRDFLIALRRGGLKKAWRCLEEWAEIDAEALLEEYRNGLRKKGEFQ